MQREYLQKRLKGITAAQRAGKGLNKLNKILKNVLYFGIAQVLAKFIGGFTAFFVAKIIEPSNYGLWITMLLIASYAPIACLGTVESLLKKFPYYIGRGELDKGKEVENGVLASIIISAIIVGFFGFIFQYFIENESIRKILPLIRIMVLSAVLGFFSGYFFNRFAAYQNFKMASFIDTFRAIISFSFLVSFSWAWGLNGTIYGFFLSELIICIVSGILSLKICGGVSLNFNLKLIRNLIIIGFPITIVWWFFILQATVDRFMSISMLGRTMTGYYGLGISITSILILMPQAVGKVLYPRVNEEMGKNSKERDLTLFVITPTRVLSLLVPIMLIGLLLISPLLYLKIFLKYSPGLQSAQILILGAFFGCLTRNGVNYLIAENKEGVLLKIILICLMAKIFGNYFLVKIGLGIEGIAISTGISAALLTSLIWKTVFKSMGLKLFEQFKEIINFYYPFLILCGLIGSFMLIIDNMLIETGLKVIWYIIILVTIFCIMMIIIPPMSKWNKEILFNIRTRIKGHSERRISAEI